MVGNIGLDIYTMSQGLWGGGCFGFSFSFLHDCDSKYDGLSNTIDLAAPYPPLAPFAIMASSISAKARDLCDL